MQFRVKLLGSKTDVRRTVRSPHIRFWIDVLGLSGKAYNRKTCEAWMQIVSEMRFPPNLSQHQRSQIIKNLVRSKGLENALQIEQ